MNVRDFDLQGFVETVDSIGKRKPTFGYLKSMIAQDASDLAEIFLSQFGAPDTKAIIKVIKDEPTLITGQLISTSDKCKNPRHCVVGALFYHAGMSNKRLKELQSRYGAGTEKLPIWAHVMLWKHYNLSPIHTAELMEGNDRLSEVEAENDDADSCEIVNKRDLIAEVNNFGPLGEDGVGSLLSFGDHKGGREFLKPFFYKAYKEWVRLGIKAMEAQTKEFKKRLTLKVS